MLIFKVLKEEEFVELQKKRSSVGSPKDLTDGFIHFSTKEQLRETVRLHYSGQKNLILMAIDSNILKKNLIWESSRNGQVFPHLYSKLQFDSALWFAPLELKEGTHIFPAGL